MAYHLTVEAQQPIRLLQISDPHLMEDPEAEFLGVKPLQSLSAVIEQLRGQQFDCVLSSGDIAQQPGATTYQRYMDLVASLQTAHFWLRGNHDAGETFPQQTTDDEPTVVVMGRWCMILLNSHKPQHVNGEISQQQFDFVADFIQKNPDYHYLIALHHPCFEVGSAWLDQHKLINSTQFLQFIGQFPQIRVVLCGHVHQEFSLQHQHVNIFSCPSTWRQFAAQSDEFALQQTPPGYRLLTLEPDGNVQTHVEYVKNWQQPIDDSRHHGY